MKHSQTVQQQRALQAYLALRKQANEAFTEEIKLALFGLNEDADAMRVHHARLLLRCKRLATLAGICLVLLMGCEHTTQHQEPTPRPMWTHVELERAVRGAWLGTYPGVFPDGQLSYMPHGGVGQAMLVALGEDEACLVQASECREIVRSLVRCASLFAAEPISPSKEAVLLDDASWICDRERDARKAFGETQ